MRLPLKGRPVLAAALIYAVLAVLFVSPGADAGQDALELGLASGSSRPGAACKPAALKPPEQPRARRRARAVAAVPALHGQASCRTSRSGTRTSTAGRPFLGERAVGDLLAVQLARLRAAVLDGARADRGAEAVGGGVRDVPARPGARHALRRRAAGRGRLRLSLWMVTWISYPHASVWALIPWLLLLTDRWCAGPTCCGRRPRWRWSACSSWRAPGVELPRAARRPWLLRAAAVAGVAAPRAGARRRCARAGVRRRARWRGGAAAAVLLPFAELLLHSADLHARGGHVGRPARLARVTRSGSSCRTTGAGRPQTPTASRSCWTRASTRARCR